MRLTKSLLVAGCFMLSLTGSQAVAEIYKITKADGSVVFTDQPAYDASNKIEIVSTPKSPSNSNQANTTRVPSSSASSNNSAAKGDSTEQRQQAVSTIAVEKSRKEENAVVNYKVEIVTPSKERAYRKPAQTIDVVVDVQPSLSKGDQVIITIDGEEMASGTSVNIPTVDLLPGEHTLTAIVINGRGHTFISPPRTFFIIQNTMAMQNKRKLNQQLNAYYELPWYKRLMVQLKGNKPSEKSSKQNAPKVSTAFR